ncbi:MAG: hypothetical protein GC162_08280 [Planctomycetes bacterium]|nr:hypothetical protein [Planctomycetota bacterium]
MGDNVKCSSCGVNFHAIFGGMPCPYCGQPQKAADGSAVAFAAPIAQTASNLAPDAPDAIERQPCPMCGELIAAGATQCRYCGEVFSAPLRDLFGGEGDLSDPGWLKVAQGLRLIYLGVCIIVLGAILFGVGAAIMSGTARGRVDEISAFVVLAGFAGLIFLGAFITMIVGQVKCTAVPEATGARGMINGAVVCLIISILCNIIVATSKVEEIELIAGLVSMVGYFLFMLFIQRTAIHLGDEPTARSAKHLMGTMAGIYLAMIVFRVLSITDPNAVDDPGAVTGILGLIVGLGGLICLFWYLRLIVGLRKRILAMIGL